MRYINPRTVLFLFFFFQLFSVSSFSLVLDPRGRLEEKVGSAYEEFDDSEGGILTCQRVLVPAHAGSLG